MTSIEQKNEQRIRRRRRTRAKIQGTSARPRLAVFRSNRRLWLQLIDDVAGHTIAAAHEREVPAEKKGGRTARAERLGELLARRAAEKAIVSAAFDRGHYRYHGLVRAVAEGARKGGLKM
ncbi:MAG: 50S ribosomal protein L18 [Patescibacteria group bacterium]